MSDEEKLAELLVRWEDGYDKGRDLSPEELCRDTPHLVELVAQEIAKRKRIRNAATATWSPVPPPSPPKPPPPAPVKAFAGLRFEPKRHHASGGLGDVFVAVDQEVGREVALKRHAAAPRGRFRLPRPLRAGGGDHRPAGASRRRAVVRPRPRRRRPALLCHALHPRPEPARRD